MTPSNTPDARPTRTELAAQLSEELIRLRDALVSLSISLKDWQFEADQNGQRTSQKIAAEALDKYRLQGPNVAVPGQASRSSASEG